VRDSTGTTQVTLKKGSTPPELFETLERTPRESVIEAEGEVKLSTKTQRGLELVPHSIHVVTQAEVPLPLGVVDKVGAELSTRLDHRVLDLRKPAVRSVFELRAALLDGFRQAFIHRGFLEVETPKVLAQGAEGGATLFPVDYFERRAYLAQSPQLYKQMLMGAGFDRVFEIGPAFRAEPSDTVRHITEFTSLDAEVAYIREPDELRSLLEQIVAEALDLTRTRLEENKNPLAGNVPKAELPFPRVPFSTCEEWLGRPGGGTDFGADDEKRIAGIVERDLAKPFYFITDFPAAAKAQTFYARRRDDDPTRTMYFDLYCRDLELASGGPREHRLNRLLANMRSAGLDPALFEAYLEAFRFGMPTHGGWGFGVDRFVQAVAQLPNIRESRLFPRDRYRLEP